MHKLKIYGTGGQGVVTAAKILAHAISVYDGKYAKTAHFYGHERRGAPVCSDVMIDTKIITLSSYVYNPNFIVLFDALLPNKGVNLDIKEENKPVLIINSDNGKFLTEYNRKYPFCRIYNVNATEIAMGYTHKNIPNIPMLAAIAKTSLVDIKSIVCTIEELFDADVKDININMAMDAYEKTKIW